MGRRVLVEDHLVTVSLGEKELKDCALIPYLERTFSYDGRYKVGIIWHTMQRIGDGGQSITSPSGRRKSK